MSEQTPETDAGYVAHYAHHEYNRKLCERLERERDALRQQLGDLLAVIHRDGGHHTANVGVKQSVTDAIEMWGARTIERDALREALRELREECKKEGWLLHASKAPVMDRARAILGRAGGE